MSRAILPDPPDELKQWSERLAGALRQELRDSGFMPFARFMERALYEPGLGYYSAGLHKLGPGGDFTTAPELGSLFAECLAAQVGEIAAALGDYDVLEVGAGTGRLAVDLLRTLPSDRWPRRYRILERSADLRAVQRACIEREPRAVRERTEWIDQPPAGPWRGVVIANEVLDALPVERFRISQGGVEQAGVAETGQGFGWVFRPAPVALTEAVERLRLDPVPGYTSEINLLLGDWLAAICAGLDRGAALFCDYGYPRREYYRPERSDGTLIGHYRHRAHTDVLRWPGLQDISAFVEFTALAEAAESCGLALAGYTSQAQFLLGCGLDELLERRKASAAAELAAEARRLTWPGMMGEKFQVMALQRGEMPPLRGFSLQDLSYRL